MGQLASYGDVAACIGAPSSARAVGTAIGQNPVAFLIPCHRVIRANGHIGDYAWGAARKTAMIGWEGARASQAHANNAPTNNNNVFCHHPSYPRGALYGWSNK